MGGTTSQIIAVRSPCLPGFLAFFVLALSGVAGHAEYVGPFPGVTKVGEILKAPVNDRTVVLRGSLISRLGVKLYQFRDGSGEIVVEIAPQVFSRTPIKAETVVEIRGQVETGWKDGPRIEVDDLAVMPATAKDAEGKAKPQ